MKGQEKKGSKAVKEEERNVKMYCSSSEGKKRRRRKNETEKVEEQRWRVYKDSVKYIQHGQGQ